MRANSTADTVEATRIVKCLERGIREVLGDGLLGLYLDGSLALGGFDAASDVDFVAVTERPVDDAVFARLQSMHDRLAQMESPLAEQIEGVYATAEAVRTGATMPHRVPNIERGRGERLKWISLGGPWWLIHQAVLREHGVVLHGPKPATFIGPIPRDVLSGHMRAMLLDMQASFNSESPTPINRGYQSYMVLTLCRIAYTLHTGAIASKAAAAEWATGHWGERWRPLIEAATRDRHQPAGSAAPANVDATRELLTWLLIAAPDAGA